MKRLIVALVAAVAVSTAFARVPTTELFENNDYTNVFRSVDAEADDSRLVEYQGDGPAFSAPYPCESFGDRYLLVDACDTTLWCSNTAATGNVYFDMAMKFNVSASLPDLGEDTKVAVYQNASSNLVVVAGDGTPGRTQTEYAVASIDPGTWGRVTIASFSGNNGLYFKVFLNENELSCNGTNEFQSLTSDTNVSQMGISGSGAIDDFVVRTTDPFIQSPAAKIGEEGYASLEDALGEVADYDPATNVTLYADHAATISIAQGQSYRINNNSHTFGGFVGVGETAVTKTTVGDIDTYTAVDGVAAVSPNGTDWTWFATFEDAYANALTYPASNAPDLKVKVGGDFTPNISVVPSWQTFFNIEFVSTTESPITINMMNGSVPLIARNTLKFPSNATLNIASGSTIKYISGGTLNILPGVTVTLNRNPYYAFQGIAALSGSGTIVVPDKQDEGSTYAYLTFKHPGQNFPAFLRGEAWQGTVEFRGASTNASEALVCDLANVANSASTIRFNGFTAPMLGGDYSVYDMDIELVESGLTIGGDYTRDYVFTGKLSGTGMLAVTSDQTKPLYLYMTGDTSSFAGGLNIAGQTRFVFGNTTRGGNGSITIAADQNVTNATGKTWTASDLIVVGELTADGTVALTGSLWGNTGTGVYRANTSAAAVSVAGSWNGKYVIGWEGDNDTAIAFDSYGNDKSTIEIPAGSTLQGYIGSAQGVTYNLAAKEFVVNGVLNLSNGYNNSTVGWKKITGSGTLKFSFAPSGAIHENITLLDGFTGSIEVSKTTQLEIGTVNVATAPADGACVVPMTVAAGGTVGGYLALSVGGVDTGKTLAYDANGAQGAGLYVVVAAPTVDITVPTVANATATVTTNGVEVSGNGDGTYTVEEGAAVTITYAANAGYVLSGTSVYTIASATEGATITITDTTVAAEIAAVYRSDAKVAGYASLRAAVAAAQAGDTVVLLADDRVSFTAEAPEIGISKALTINGAGFTLYGVNDYAGSGDHDIFISGSSDVTIKNLTLAEFGAEKVPNNHIEPIWTGQAYAGNLTLDNVTVSNFNHTAINLNGGTVVVTNCTLVGDTTPRGTGDNYYQRGICTYRASVTVVDTVIEGMGAYSATDERSSAAGCFEVVGFDENLGSGTIDVVDGTYEGQFAALVGINGSGTISISGGEFDGLLQVDDGSAGAISITGGTYSVDPTAYVAQGYKATESAGVWTVSEDTGTPVEPGKDDGKTYNDQSSAEAAAASVVVVASDAVTNVLSGADLADYLGKFEVKVVEVGGSYKVVVGMTDEAKTDLQNDVSTNVYVSVAASLPDIVADAAGDTTEISVTGATPGFYYWISYGTSLGAMTTTGTAVLAPASGSITLTTPAKAENATAGFYRVNVGTEPPVTP